MGITHSVSGQNGAHIKAGISLVGDIDLSSYSDTSFHHKAYHVGVDARIGPFGFFLSPGLHYYAVDIRSTTGFDFLAQAPKYHIIKGPVNLGYKIFINRRVKLRVQGGVDVNYILLIDENPYGITFNDVNDIFVGLNVGTGLDVGRLTFDLNYESGLSNVMDGVDDTELSFLSLSLGVFF